MRELIILYFCSISIGILKWLHSQKSKINDCSITSTNMPTMECVTNASNISTNNNVQSLFLKCKAAYRAL